MSNKKDKTQSRRSLIAAAVAAGAALPLVSVGAKAQSRGTKVVVDLGGVELPEAVAAKLEMDIRRAVLLAVAQGAPKIKFTNGPLGPGIRGIIMRPVGLPGAMEPHM